MVGAPAALGGVAGVSALQSSVPDGITAVCALLAGVLPALGYALKLETRIAELLVSPPNIGHSKRAFGNSPKRSLLLIFRGGDPVRCADRTIRGSSLCKRDPAGMGILGSAP
jgi:hypothetical protein